MNASIIAVVLGTLLIVPIGAVGATTAPPAATVHIRNDAFVPSKIVVRVNDVVRFVNDDDDAHTVTATDNSFDSRGLDTGASWDHRFGKAGTVSYFCALHPFMKATVIVKVGR